MTVPRSVHTSLTTLLSDKGTKLCSPKIGQAVKGFMWCAPASNYPSLPFEEAEIIGSVPGADGRVGFRVAGSGG